MTDFLIANCQIARSGRPVQRRFIAFLAADAATHSSRNLHSAAQNSMAHDIRSGPIRKPAIFPTFLLRTPKFL
jgi:hypothetical protein